MNMSVHAIMEQLDLRYLIHQWYNLTMLKMYSKCCVSSLM